MLPVAASQPTQPAAPAPAGAAAPTVAKLPPVAIGSLPPSGIRLRAPREDVVRLWLQQDGAIPLNATPEQIKAAVDGYLARFAKKTIDWVNPKIQEMALKREADLAKSRAGILAIQPVTATVLGLAVDFGATETFTSSVDDGAGGCISETMTIVGPRKGLIAQPDPQDNNTVWYSPTVTANASFYEKLAFGYEGVGRARFDLTDPRDGQPGIDLAGYTVQDYYDHVAGDGNVVVTGTIQNWVTVPHSEGYYGAPNCARGQDDSGAGVPKGKLAIDAITVFSATNPSYYNDTSANAFWKRYDANGDGVVDAFWIIHAGMGEEGGGGAQGPWSIWSHSWSLSAQGWIGGY